MTDAQANYKAPEVKKLGRFWYVVAGVAKLDLTAKA